MPNLNQILKEEMTRLAKREIKQQVEPLKDQLVDVRRTAREQRRRIEQLERELAKKADKERLSRIVSEDEDVRVRKGSVKKHRERLGISQREMGLLLEVSNFTISNWELDKSSPNGQNKLAFAELRAMGVREVRARLDGLEDGS